MVLAVLKIQCEFSSIWFCLTHFIILIIYYTAIENMPVYLKKGCEKWECADHYNHKTFMRNKGLSLVF